MLLFLLSGATGLVYELIWTRQLIIVFGGTTYAITTVLVSFMAGLGLGCFLAGRRANRMANPGLAYGVLEIGIGLYALLVPVLFHAAEPIYRALYPMVSDRSLTVAALIGVRFLLCTCVLIVPTTCMGATLPLLVRQLTLGRPSRGADGERPTRGSDATGGGEIGRSVGRLYGINTLGAVFGTVGAGFWLIPALGLSATTRLAAAGNVLIGLAAIALFRRTSDTGVGRLRIADCGLQIANSATELNPQSAIRNRESCGRCCWRLRYRVSPPWCIRSPGPES